MRVVLISKAMVVGAYQRKAEEIARQPGIELTVIVPPFWNEETRRVNLERAYTSGYELLVEPLLFSGHFHIHLYPRLDRTIARIQPQVVHADEEPYNLATAEMIMLGRRHGAATMFFSWQNLMRRYPPPFNLFERYNMWRTDYAVAGNADAASVLRRKGFRGPMAVLPQFGVDPDIFRRPEGWRREPGQPFTIGYVGRLVEQKGLVHLVRSVSQLEGDWRLVLLGSGPLENDLREQAEYLGIAERVQIKPPVPSVAVPAEMLQLDTLVLPSLTRSNWKEQFGRVLIEGMASQLPVIGSDSGEIPNVLADAGLVYPEGNDEELRDRLRRLMASEPEREHYGALGRQRVLNNYSNEHLAREYAAVYRQAWACKSG